MKDIEEKIGYLKEHICNKDGDKDYLFISYKSCLLYTSPSPRD